MWYPQIHILTCVPEFGEGGAVAAAAVAKQEIADLVGPDLAADAIVPSHGSADHKGRRLWSRKTSSIRKCGAL